MKRVIELLRVSTEAQAGEDRAGLPAQRAANQRTAAQFGLEIIDTIELIDISGTSVLYAPGYQRLLERIADPSIAGVVAKEFSRLVRPESWEDGVILQRFVETGTVLYLPDGPLDPSTRQGRILATLQGLMSGLEGSLIRERMMAGKESLRRRGRWVSGPQCLPLGVDYNPTEHKFSYNADAEKVRDVFRQFLAGQQNYNVLAETLEMTRGSVRNILENELYTGWLVIDEKRDLSPAAKKVGPDGRRRDRPRIKRAAEDVIRQRVIDEPLISQADFDRAQVLIRQKVECHIRMRQRVGEFTYASFLWCAQCGQRLYSHRNERPTFYYRCANRKRKDGAGDFLCPASYMNRDLFEPTLDQLFSEQLTDRAFLRRLYDHQVDQSKRHESESRLVRLRSNVERLTAKRQRLMDLYLDGALSREEHRARLTQFDRELRQAKSLLEAEKPAPVVDAATLAEVFAPFVEFKFLQRDQKRRMLSSLGPTIRAANYKVESLSLDGNVVNRWTVVTPIAIPKVIYLPIGLAG